MNHLMPAEWAKHAATWLAWPHDITTFPSRIPQAEKIFTETIFHLHTGETVELFVLDEAMRAHASTQLQERGVDLTRVNFHIMDYADVWTRDTAPTFIFNKDAGKQALIKWKFNAYGNKFPPLLKDNAMADEVGKYLNLPLITSSFICEGGAIETNGAGILLTTEECLLNPNRNPNQSKQNIETELKTLTGAKQVIWLEAGLVNDHTDGHIDEIARFVSIDKIACAFTDDKNNPNFKILEANYQTLSQMAEVIKLPLPNFYYDDGELAPASYVNFYIANLVVLVPQFNDANDKPALAIIQSLFPERPAIGIDCTDLIYGGGTVHCVTQQQPAV